jgi:hypothetical protein
MSRKFIVRWILTAAVLSVVTIIWGMLSTTHVRADCGSPPKSTCSSCHIPGSHVEVMGEWNSVHLAQDMCINCHGGNGNAMDEGLAHEGMAAQPLSDIFTNCHSCHPIDYLARSEQLAVSLNVTPASCATPTVVAAYGESGGSNSSRIAHPSDHSGGTPVWKLIMMGGIGLTGLIVFLLGLVWLDGHRINGQ